MSHHYLIFETAGGFCGIYLGARAQKYLPQNLIKAILALLLLFLAIRYIGQFFW